jgi:hypothetical protein
VARPSEWSAVPGASGGFGELARRVDRHERSGDW